MRPAIFFGVGGIGEVNAPLYRLSWDQGVILEVPRCFSQPNRKLTDSDPKKNDVLLEFLEFPASTIFGDFWLTQRGRR